MKTSILLKLLRVGIKFSRIRISQIAAMRTTGAAWLFLFPAWGLAQESYEHVDRNPPLDFHLNQVDPLPPIDLTQPDNLHLGDTLSIPPQDSEIQLAPLDTIPPADTSSELEFTTPPVVFDAVEGGDATNKGPDGGGDGSGDGGRDGGSTPPYIVNAVIPGVCFVGSEIDSEIPGEIISPTCDVLDAGQMSWELLTAPSADEVEHILSELAAEKMVYMSFPDSWGVGERAEVVRAMYDSMAQFFDDVAQRIVVEMEEDPEKAQQLEAWAIQDAARVEEVRQQAFEQARNASDEAVSTIQSHPHAGGISFRCQSACHQLISAAHGINAFD